MIKRLIDRFIRWRDQDIFKFARKPAPYMRYHFIEGTLNGRRYKIKVTELWYEEQRKVQS